MATMQSPQLSMANSERANCVQSEFPKDHYFSLHVIGVRDPEPDLNEVVSTSHVQGRSNGRLTNGVHHAMGEKLSTKSYESCRTINGLSHLPLAGHSIAELERESILQTLQSNLGNRKRSAEILGISVRTLQRKLKEWSNGFS